jgi:hypothetical protein
VLREMEGGESEPDRPAGVEAAADEAEWQVVSPADVAGVEEPKVVEWEDMEQEIARLWSLSSALREAKERKEVLSESLNSFIKVSFFFPSLLSSQIRCFWGRAKSVLGIISLLELEQLVVK